MKTTDLQVLYVIDSLHQGGAEQSLVDLAPRLIGAGVDLEIVVLKSGGMLEEQALDAGARLTYLGAPDSRRARTTALTELISQRQPDVVHTTLFESDIVGRPAAARRRVPVVSSIVNLAYGSEHRDAPGMRSHRLALAQITDAVTARFVRRFHTNSSALVKPMSRRLLVSPRRFDVIPRGRDPEALGTRSPERRAQVRSSLGLDDSHLVVLAAARREHQKGLDVLLTAVGKVKAERPNLRVLIAGRDGSRSESLEMQARAEGLTDTVQFLGARNDVADLMVASDLFVLPSRWEGLPGTVIEAMALETPVVATDLPGVREVLGPLATAAVVPVDDADALATRMLFHLAHPEEGQRLAMAARSRFLRQFTTTRVAQKMVAFYEGAISEG